MIFVPAWITNILYLLTFCISAFQHWQLKRPNPVTNIQFFMMVFCLAMMLTVTLYNRENPWLSLGLFLAAMAGLELMVRQNRMLPPMKPFQ